MQVGRSGTRLVARDDATGRWAPIGGAWHDDLLAFLAGGARARAEARAPMATARPIAAPDGLPFRPRSLRQFALWEEHMTNAARMLVRRFAPPHTRALVAAYERATRRTFPALRPGAKFREVPGFYLGNHTTVLPDGATVPWPRYTAYLDFELELAAVVAHPVRDCTAAAGRAAIGGFCVLNDWSARDVQWDDARRGAFGGMVKAKTCATALGATVVTADEVLGRWPRLAGRVRVNGAVWCSGHDRGGRPRPGRDGGLRGGRGGARAGRRARDGDAARLLRAGAGPLGGARGRGHARDRRGRGCRQPRGPQGIRAPLTDGTRASRASFSAARRPRRRTPGPPSLRSARTGDRGSVHLTPQPPPVVRIIPPHEARVHALPTHLRSPRDGAPACAGRLLRP